VGSLYVSNLSWDASEDDVRDYFMNSVVVNKVTIIKDRDTGRSRGFCFVDVDNSENANADLDGTTFMGRTISVSPARPPEKREFRDSRPPRDDRPRHYSSGY